MAFVHGTRMIMARGQDPMWEIFAGITLWIIIYPVFAEWRQHQLDKKRLADMRRHFSLKHRWDALQGRWMDD